jgi:hypothetical protein
LEIGNEASRSGGELIEKLIALLPEGMWVLASGVWLRTIVLEMIGANVEIRGENPHDKRLRAIG